MLLYTRGECPDTNFFFETKTHLLTIEYKLFIRWFFFAGFQNVTKIFESAPYYYILNPHYREQHYLNNSKTRNSLESWFWYRQKNIRIIIIYSGPAGCVIWSFERQKFLYRTLLLE